MTITTVLPYTRLHALLRFCILLTCFLTVPEDGFISPVNILIIVDLPAPLAPTQATLDAMEHFTVTPMSCGFLAPGYVKSQLLICKIGVPLVLTPSNIIG